MAIEAEANAVAPIDSTDPGSEYSPPSASPSDDSVDYFPGGI